ncbi:MAG: response regulator [Clostridiales bacterium]|nr:response regulator [Clostridiales bacterium]
MDNIKVFICEDESIVREGLRDMIPWEKYGFEFVGDAPDGEMALPMIRSLKPDVLITDITMPFMDGLSLCRVVMSELPDIKIIIISGYSDFEYARQAISLGVEQYLLKPVTKADMIKVIEEVKQKISEASEQQNYISKYEQEFKKFERFSHRAFFEKLVEGSMSVQQIYEQANELHLNLSANGYNLVIYTVRDAEQSSYADDAANVMESLFGHFMQYPDYILFRCNLLSYAVLIKGEFERLPELTDRCVDMIRQHCEEAHSNLEWYAAVGVPTKRLSGLSACYSDANRAFAYRHLFPDKHIFTSELVRTKYNTPNAGEVDSIDAAKLDPMIIRNFVRTGSLAETESFADEYIASLDGTENPILFRYYLLVSIRVNVELALREEGIPKTDIDMSLSGIDMEIEADEFRNNLIDTLRKAITLRDAEAMKRNSDIIDSAMRYIDNHYKDEDISLDSVAIASNISANYLSAMFSQKVGLSFVEYVTKKRMEKAKQLLRKTDKRSGEIASEVGYKDPRYFSFVFKKKTGCTPSQYRNGEYEEE